MKRYCTVFFLTGLLILDATWRRDRYPDCIIRGTAPGKSLNTPGFPGFK